MSLLAQTNKKGTLVFSPWVLPITLHIIWPEIHYVHGMGILRNLPLVFMVLSWCHHIFQKPFA